MTTEFVPSDKKQGPRSLRGRPDCRWRTSGQQPLFASWYCDRPPAEHCHAALGALQLQTVIEQHPGFNFEPPSNARNVVDRDIAFRPLDPAEIGAIDTALVGQGFLAQPTLRSKAAHIPRQYVPQRPFVSLFHARDFGPLTLLRRPLLSYIRRSYLQMRMLLR